PAAGGIRRAASRLCAAARSHERGKLAWGITMLEMPPLQFAQTNGIRMGYYEAGPKTDTPPVILCHGWPEIAFSWRHQIKALAAAGIRVIAPDQRGYGATDRPEAAEEHDSEHVTGHLTRLLPRVHTE